MYCVSFFEHAGPWDTGGAQLHRLLVFYQPRYSRPSPWSSRTWTARAARHPCCSARTAVSPCGTTTTITRPPSCAETVRRSLTRRHLKPPYTYVHIYVFTWHPNVLATPACSSTTDACVILRRASSVSAANLPDSSPIIEHYSHNDGPTGN